jgi:alpha-amylase/alpha-mannosidase (GH57 family)
VDDVRDLQVLHKLVWMDPDWLRSDQRLRRLLAKERGYDEDDKTMLRSVELELLNAVIPAYQEAHARGQIELSTSPFYHPILPLLCDTDVHLHAHPHSSLPRQLFAHPDDAIDQLQRALALHQTIFGQPATGVWPSEGAVSDEVIAMLASAGCSWTATDEDVLSRSLQRSVTADLLYRSYEVGPDGRTMRCLFRDHGLSDLIGFAYQSWEADAAADDFVARVREAGRRYSASARAGETSGGEVATVTVILDGENAWEHYPGGGRPFLRALYDRLAGAGDIETVTMSDAAAGAARRLESVSPGSWINGDFYIWAGHADDHRAWRQLAAARDAFERALPSLDPDARAHARQELFIAEGSDWFWWYGDDHSSDQDREFDDLFRRHLRNAYRAMGQPAPDDLYSSNITTAPAVHGALRLRGFVRPMIDGSAAPFDEWAASTEVPLCAGGGTMHRVAGQLVRALRVGVDRLTLYLRVDGPDLVRRVAADDLRLALLSHPPHHHRLALLDHSEGVRSAVGDVVEIRVPFERLGVQSGDRLRLSLLVTDVVGQLVEQHPCDQPFELDVPTRHLEALNWIV